MKSKYTILDSSCLSEDMKILKCGFLLYFEALLLRR